jgi:hypothetical protein
VTSKRARKFYAVMAVAMALGLALNFAGFNAVKMLFWLAVINGLLAPPLILLVILLTCSHKVMGKRVNSPFERSRWRDGRFACYAPHVMPQGRAFNGDFRFSLIFLSQAKSIGCKRKKIQFP